jgi:hypothetical protein
MANIESSFGWARFAARPNSAEYAGVAARELGRGIFCFVGIDGEKASHDTRRMAIRMETSLLEADAMSAI